MLLKDYASQEKNRLYRRRIPLLHCEQQKGTTHLKVFGLGISLLFFSIVPVAAEGLDWKAPVVIGSTNFYQGYFENVAPWIAPGVTIVDVVVDNSGNANPDINNAPGRYPVAYQRNITPTGSNHLILEAFLPADGGYSSHCESLGTYDASQLSVRSCASEYPSRASHVNQGVSWLSYYGGTVANPEYARNSEGERIAEALRQVGLRHAEIIDEGAGITLQGSQYGGVGAIHQSMIIPNIQDQISVVYARRAITGFNLWTYTESVGTMDKAWGAAANPSIKDTIAFELIAPTGVLDNVWYRIDGSTLDPEAPIHPDYFFNHCETNKIGCSGTWNAGTTRSGIEAGVTIPQEKYTDANMIVRLDTPIPIYTNSTANTALTASRGHYNLGLTWNTAAITQTANTVTMPLKYKAFSRMGGGVADMPATITASVTIRRSDIFVMTSGEAIAWSWNGTSGVATANAKGEITIDALGFTSSESAYTDLVLTKGAPVIGSLSS